MGTLRYEGKPRTKSSLVGVFMKEKPEDKKIIFVSKNVGAPKEM
jgi:hypothetical protein